LSEKEKTLTTWPPLRESVKERRKKERYIIMPPKLKPTDFIDALSESGVVDALAKALTPFITLSIEESLKTKLNEFELLLRDLKLDNVRLNNKCESLNKESEALKKIVSDQNRRIDDLEAYSRCDNLIIREYPRIHG